MLTSFGIIICFIQRNVAVEYKRATGLGLLVQFSSHMDRLDVLYLDCTPFSNSTDQQQILFFGGQTVLRITGIEYYNFKFDDYIASAQALLKIIAGQKVNVRRDANKKMHSIVRGVLRRHAGEDAVGREGYLIDLVMFNLKRASQIRLRYCDVMMGRYQGLGSIFKMEESDIYVLDITNISVFFKHSETITFILEETDIIEFSEWQSIVNQLAVIYDLGLTTAICFEFPPQSKWHQKTLFNAGFLALPSVYELEMHDNVLSFQVTPSAMEQAEALEHVSVQERAQQMSEQLVETNHGHKRRRTQLGATRISFANVLGFGGNGTKHTFKN